MNTNKKNDAVKQNKEINFSQRTATFDALKAAENKNKNKNNK
jgi:hypothetical protein